MANMTAKNAVNKQQNIPSKAAAQQAKILQVCNLCYSHYAKFYPLRNYTT